MRSFLRFFDQQRTVALVACVVASFNATAVTAQEPETEGARPCFVFPVAAAWNCSLSLRGDTADLRLSRNFPAPPVAERTALLDLNITGKGEFTSGTRYFLDIDGVARRSWDFSRRDLLTGAVLTTQSSDSENPSYRMSVNELYSVFEPVPEFQFVLGKKRILWGSGLAINPTDALNPSKNFLDPTQERRGSWLFLAERVREKNTLSFLFAPRVVEDKNTIPTDILIDGSGSVERWQALSAVRWYQLAGNADLNFMIFRNDRFKDDVESPWMGGASWSQSLLSLSKQLEGHAEVLVRRGSPRPDAGLRARNDDNSLYYSFLYGHRYDFENESALIVEFFRQSDGDARTDLRKRLEGSMAAYRALVLGRGTGNPSSDARSGATSDAVAGSTSAAAAQSEAPRTVSALSQQNYLFVNWQRYKFNDDLFLSWSVVHNLHDGAGYLGPILQWTPTQSSSVTLTANTDYALLPDTGVLVQGAGRVRESDLNPVKFRFGMEMKSYF
jgi:hypothetical protein